MGKRNGQLKKERYKTALKHMTRYSNSLVKREMQIKTTLKYHFLPTILAKIQNLTVYSAD